MTKEVSFCASCGSVNVIKLKIGTRFMFKCNTCGALLPYTFTRGGNLKVGKLKDGTLMHYSVGAIIKKGKKILMFDRAYYPFGYACVAGHVKENETYASAIKREIKEETGLEVIKLKKLLEEDVANNPCSRGVKAHHWVVYEAKCKGSLKPGEETNKLRYYSLEEIKHLKLEPVWEHFFRKLGVLK